MQDVRIVVEDAADAVAAEVAHHRCALRFGIGLDGRGDVAEGVAWLHLSQAAFDAFISDVDQAASLGGDRADLVHARGVAVPAVQDRRDVDIDDVAFAQGLFRRNAVADDVVGRNAHGVLIAAIEDAGRQGAVVEDEFARQIVELRRHHARHHIGDQHVETIGGQAAGLAHACEILIGMDADGFGTGEEIGVCDHARNIDCEAGFG